VIVSTLLLLQMLMIMMLSLQILALFKRYMVNKLFTDCTVEGLDAGRHGLQLNRVFVELFQGRPLVELGMVCKQVWLLVRHVGRVSFSDGNAAVVRHTKLLLRWRLIGSFELRSQLCVRIHIRVRVSVNLGGLRVQ